MAFQVGAIISKLTLDKSGWDKAAKGVAADQKKMQGMSDKTAKKFRTVGKAMTIAGGVIVGALGAMTKKFVETGDWIDKMSKRTGIGAEALSELAYAADLSGASLTDVEKSVKRMSGTILDAHSGLETYVRAFDQIGVSVDDLMQMNPEQQFLAISEAIASIEDPTIRAAIAQDIFGRAGTALLPMMTDGAEGLRKMREEARDLGIIYTTETAKSAADLKDAQTALKESVKGLSMAFTQHLVPLLTDLVKKITDTVAKVSEWARENPKLAKTIIKIAGGLGGLLLTLGPILMIMPKLVSGAGALGKAFTFLLSPTGLLIAALAALAIGYMKVKQAQEAAEKSSRTAAEQEAKLFKKLKESAEAAGMTAAEFDKLKEAYDDNAAALAMAIKRGDEGIEMQKALKEHTSDYEIEAEKAAEETKNLGFNVEDLTGRFQGYLDVEKEVVEETKTWVDYLKDMGVKTVKEKEERVKELTTYLGQLDKAYEKGLISLKDYVESTNAAKTEIEELSTELTKTTIPAARDMSAVYDQSVTDMTIKTGDFTVETAKKVSETESSWVTMSQRIKDAWTRELGEMLLGAKSFKDAAGAVWDEIKRMFADMVAKMVVNFAIDGVKDLIGGAKDAASGIGKAVESVGSATAPLAAGIGTLITTLAQAIATAAEIIAASAPAILIAAGVALAIYAGFKVIGALFKKKAGPGSELDFLRQITENTFTIKELFLGDYKAEIHTSQGILRDIFGKVASLNPKADARLKVLRDIAKNTEPLKKMISAARGAVVEQPTFAALHGSKSDPEIVSPVSKLIDGFKGIGGGSANLTQAVNVQINIKNQLDAYAAQEITRKQIVPNVLKAIELDAKNKTKMRQILGVQV